MSITVSRPTWRRSSTSSPTTSATGAPCWRSSGRSSRSSIEGTKELRITDVLEALNGILARPHLSAARRRHRSAPLPDLRHGHAVAASGQVRRVHRAARTIPSASSPRPLVASGDGDAEPAAWRTAPRCCGEDPVTKLPVTLRDGRFGPYVQLGEGEKPKRQSLPKGLAPAALTFEKALALLALPREVARHPESGEPITASIGKFGPMCSMARPMRALIAPTMCL